MVKRPVSEPQFAQIAADIRQAIEGGTYPTGSALPSHKSLAAQYGVSEQTVNNAVRLLRTEGLVYVDRGNGTRVRGHLPRPIERDAVRRYLTASREENGAKGAFWGEVTRAGYVPRSETTVSDVVPPAYIADILAVPQGEPVVRRLRHMFADDVPVQLAPSYIPVDVARGTQLAETDSGAGGIVSRFAEMGHAQVRITEAITSRPATDEERDFLQLEAGQPILQILHTGWTAQGRAVEVCVHAIVPSEWVLDYEFPIS